MIRQEKGLTLVELMITVVVFLFAITAASQIFTSLLTQFKQQSKIGESNIEGVVGLDILRRDIQHAGYGLPWNARNATGQIGWDKVPNYCEAVSGGTPNPADFNDGAAACAVAGGGKAPRPAAGRNNASFSGANDIFDGSDYLVIKSLNVSTNFAAGKWQRLNRDASGNLVKQWWTSTAEYICRDEKNPNASHYSWARVIVVAPGTNTADLRTLVVSNDSFSPCADVGCGVSVDLTNFVPTTTQDTWIEYGVHGETDAAKVGVDLRMPFNRADYFIRRYDSGGNNITPSRCAPNTGVLEKVVLNHNGGTQTNFLPLLDCVADMQVVYGLDMSLPDPDGVMGTFTDGDVLAPYVVDTGFGASEGATPQSVKDTLLNAPELRSRLKEIRVYILAHEGTYDRDYTFDNFTAGGTSVLVGDLTLDSHLFRAFDLTKIDPKYYKNYRWKLYTLVVPTTNLR